MNRPIRLTSSTKSRKSLKHIPKQSKLQSKRSLTTKTGRKLVVDNVFSNFAEAVGNTPLVKINFASKLTGCNIYGKCEFANPGGSIKDRAARFLIEDAERTGQLIPGKKGIVIEASAGNTGLGLALTGASKGYRTIIVIPETQTQEKKDTLRACGAYLIESGAFPFRDPRNYVHVASRLSVLLREELKKRELDIPVFYSRQWDNTANAQAHEETTSQEIFYQLENLGLSVDGFNCAVGTGGTLVGTSRGLRTLNPNITIGLTDPMGALPYTYYTTGETKMGVGTSITEGIGQSRITGNLAYGDFKPDQCWEINDTEALHVLNRLNYEEGLQVGLSSGINVAGAIKLAQHLGPGKTIVTILADNAMRYASKMYNIPFLQSKNLPTPYWLEDQSLLDEITSSTASIDSAKGKNLVSEHRSTRNITDEVNLLPELLHDIDLQQLIDKATVGVEM